MTTLLTGRRIRLASALLLGSIAVALPGHAEVDLRVQSHPITAPIDAYVRVTADDESVTGLTADDFDVTLDGRAVEQFTLTLPPSQDSSQKVSVVIVVRESPYSEPPTYSSLVDQLGIGDLVSVVKYWGDIEMPRFGGLSILPFTELDDGPGSERVTNFIQGEPPFSQSGLTHFHFDGVMAALSQFETASATLPDGPKTIVTVDCCGGRFQSLDDVIGRANASGIAIFDIGRPEWSQSLRPFMKALSANTGGIQVKLSNGAPPQDALPTMASWLKNGYRVSIPHDAIDDCNWHRLAVTVRGESSNVTFSRCDTIPEPFRFRHRLDVPAGKPVRSNPVTITGIDTAVPIRVYGGDYSIGCGTRFTSEPGRIRPGESICVRQVTPSSGGASTYTLLVVGAVSGWFTTTTAL